MNDDGATNDSSAVAEASRIFERESGISSVPYETVLVGNKTFLKFIVGRETPLYTHALLTTSKALSPDNPFAGLLGLKSKATGHFPASLEASALLTLLTRSTKEVSEGSSAPGYTVPYIPFHGREDHQLSQAASHIVRGRRGVGKSTLIRRAQDLLADSNALVVVLDMQSYAPLTGGTLAAEVFHDVCVGLADSATRAMGGTSGSGGQKELRVLAGKILRRRLPIGRAPIAVKRALGSLTQADGRQAFVFLDDFHLLDAGEQPRLLHLLNGALKGANGWLKIAGLTSLLSHYDARTREGLQVPGDAQYIALDLTLADPEAAEAHLKRILAGFLEAVGYGVSRSVIPEVALRRLVWSNAGVPRDFLQMFARSLEHAQRNHRAVITLSDVNIAIGEFGQRKMEELEKDSRNAAGKLRAMLEAIEAFCLDNRRVNAFLLRSEESEERRLIRALTDLRVIHLIHQSITPNRAGEKYEAYILDYSIFTGFRRRKNIREMLPDASQFKAAELRALPRIESGFLAERGVGAAATQATDS